MPVLFQSSTKLLWKPLPLTHSDAAVARLIRWAGSLDTATKAERSDQALVDAFPCRQNARLTLYSPPLRKAMVQYCVDATAIVQF